MAESGLVISSVQDVTVAAFSQQALLDHEQVEAAGAELTALVDEQACRQLVLDFENVKLLSSSMIGVLVALKNKSDAIGGKIVVAGLRPELHRIFQITRLDKLLTFADTQAGAVSYFGARGG